MKNFKEDDKTNPTFESKCENCVWYLGKKRCTAFGEIPKEIWNGNHDTVLENQMVDLKFESKGPIL